MRCAASDSAAGPRRPARRRQPQSQPGQHGVAQLLRMQRLDQRGRNAGRSAASDAGSRANSVIISTSGRCWCAASAWMRRAVSPPS
jgi:hypothetical protein